MKKWLFNPFIYIAGYKALILGWLIMIVTGILGYLSNTHFNGVLDHTGRELPLWISLLEPFVNWACTGISFFIISFILSKTNVRYVDIFGTLALARWPMFFVALRGFFITLPADPLSSSVVAIGFVSQLFVIWMVLLMYNAFRVSCNLRGTKSVMGFVGGLAMAEGLSLLIFYALHLYTQ